MDIKGTWKARYAVMQDDIFVNEDGFDDEVGSVTVTDGKIFGDDPWGATYEGEYTLEGSEVVAVIEVSSQETDDPFVFKGVSNPFRLCVKGDFTSPNYLSLRGVVVGDERHRIVINCWRDHDGSPASDGE